MRVFSIALALVAAFAIGVSLMIEPASLPSIELCNFKRTLGWPCPGCGLTRGFCAIGHGHFGEAWRFNPFSFLFYPLALFAIAYPFLSRRFPRRMESLARSKWTARAPLVLTAAMLVFGIVRIVSGGR